MWKKVHVIHVFLVANFQNVPIELKGPDLEIQFIYITQLYYKNQGMSSRERLPVSNVYALLKLTPLVYILTIAKASNFPLKSPLGSALRQFRKGSDCSPAKVWEVQMGVLSYLLY